MSDTPGNPEVGQSIVAAGIRTNYHDVGSGPPLLLLHGSGPGVSAWANWRLNLPVLSKERRVVAPDIVGFGFTDRPEGVQYNLETWVKHAVGFLDAMKLDRVDVVGNSFGGALTLALAVRHPSRVRRLVLMGAAGTKFDLTPGLDTAWGYTPSFENMRKMLDIFAFNRKLVTDDLAKARYEAGMRPGVQEAYAAMFPAPRQRWIEALSTPDDALRALPNDVMMIHGREDLVVPMSSSLRMLELIPRSQLHVFGQCGHWTQIEHAARFCKLVLNFTGEE